MLFSLSLAAKLGNRGLLSYSLHPGVIGSTKLGRDVDDFASLSEWMSPILRHSHEIPLRIKKVTDWATETADRTLGHKEGWEAFKFKTDDQGAATHVYASFETSLKGSILKRFCAFGPLCNPSIR
jgi:hypothetical protein